MQEAPEFSSLIVSRPGSRDRLYATARGLTVAATLYALGLTALIVAPLLVLESVDPPKAGVEPPHIVFYPPGVEHRIPSGHIQQGVRHPRSDVHDAAAPKPQVHSSAVRPADSLLPPPETESASIADLTDGTAGPEGPPGDPFSQGDKPTGPRGGPCHGCPDTGTEGPPGGDGPYAQDAPGLVPPQLVPGSRALPKFPDIARKAGLQGTVILLAVIEKDGTVGEIQVVKSPDQRWGFDLSAIDAVKQWRYQPALMDGAPVAAYIQVMVEFTLVR